MLIYHSVIEHWEFRIKYISYCIYYIYDKSEILGVIISLYEE